MRDLMSSGYRPPSREPRGRWARHIHAERKRLNWSATIAFEKLLEAGYPLGPKSRSAYLPVDEGKREPRPDEEAALVQVFGYPPEQEENGPSVVGEAGLSEVAAALREQTAAMLELVSELRLAREQSLDVRERVAAIEAYAAEHERRLQADRQLMGLARLEDSPLGSPPVEAGR